MVSRSRGTTLRDIHKKRFGYSPEQPNPSEQMEKILYTATATLSW